MGYKKGVIGNVYTNKQAEWYHFLFTPWEREQAAMFARIGYTWEFDANSYTAMFEGEVIEQRENCMSGYEDPDPGDTTTPPKGIDGKHRYASNVWKCFTAMRYHHMLHFTNLPSYVNARERKGIEKKEYTKTEKHHQISMTQEKAIQELHLHKYNVTFP